jgi:hypothetical protein
VLVNGKQKCRVVLINVLKIMATVIDIIGWVVCWYYVHGGTWLFKRNEKFLTGGDPDLMYI